MKDAIVDLKTIQDVDQFERKSSEQQLSARFLLALVILYFSVYFELCKYISFSWPLLNNFVWVFKISLKYAFCG